MSSWDDVMFDEPFEAISDAFQQQQAKAVVTSRGDASACGSPTHVLGGALVNEDLMRSFSLADSSSVAYDMGDGKTHRGVCESVSRNEILWLLQNDIVYLSEQLCISEHDAELQQRQNQYDIQTIQTALIEESKSEQQKTWNVLSTHCYMFGAGCTHHHHTSSNYASRSDANSGALESKEVFLQPVLLKQQSSHHRKLQVFGHTEQDGCRSNPSCISLLNTYFGANYTQFLSGKPQEYLPKTKFVPAPVNFVTPFGNNTRWMQSEQDSLNWTNKLPFQAVPQLFVQCSTAYCDIVPLNEATALKCGHWFCNSCWQLFLQNEFQQFKGQVLSTKCMGFHCNNTSPSHSHSTKCKCNALIPLHVLEYFIFSDMQTSLHRTAPIASIKWENPSVLVWEQVNRFVQYNKAHKVRWCSNPACTQPGSKDGTNNPYALVHLTGAVSSVTCKCGWEQCFKCGEAPHLPAPCDQTVKWKNFSDNSTDLWLLAKTKPCPKCKVRIEKNRACNHMNCIMCKHEFCWLCLGSWNMHGGQTGGYYNCTVYNNQESSGKLIDVEKTTRKNNEVLHKYNYYFGRYAQHDQGKQFTASLRDQLQECLAKVSTFMLRKISLRAATYHTQSAVEQGQAVINISNTRSRSLLLLYHARIPKAVAGITFTAAQIDSWNNSQSGRDELLRKFQFLFDAFDMLQECRSILRWSFVVSYYIKSSTEDGKKGKKQLFEMQQNLLVEPTEHLQQILEGLHQDMVLVVSKESEIRQQVGAMKKLKEFIISQVQSGAFESALMYEADLELTQAWTCSCGANNDTNGSQISKHCRKCRNCRQHDEHDCRICVITPIDL